MSDADDVFDRAWTAFKEIDAQHAAVLATIAERQAKADAFADQRYDAMLAVLAAMPVTSRISPAKRAIIGGLTDDDTVETVRAKIRAIDLQDSSARLVMVKAELDA